MNGDLESGAVRAQYESYPYPARDPKDEAKRLITGSPSHLTELTHWLFAGKIPSDRPFRILVAGGGTGDGLTMLVQQTADQGVDARITYIDLSEASRAIAEARIAKRGLSERVTFITGSLLDAGQHGPFDYIDCCGVLHHLPEPALGFQALADALAPGGGMGIMVYGRYGRMGVYETQAALRLLAPDGDEPDPKRLSFTKRYLAALPPSNRLARNPVVTDHKTGGDAGIYDLLLHSTDRAYTVPELEAEIAGAGLRRVAYIDPARYEPATYIREQDFLKRVGKLSDADRAAVAEAMTGNMSVHNAYLVHTNRDDEPVAAISPDAVPVFRDDAARNEFRAMPQGAPAMPMTLDGLPIQVPLPRDAKPILDRVDGRRTLAEIQADMPGAPDWGAFEARFDAVFRVLNGFSRLFLRRP